jgi:tRNA threonylcarbamoyl adenosine modification protein YeaZ
MPMLEQVLAAAGVGWRDLDALAVGIGPGNFTGIRVSVAAARGLALALGIPALGVSGFELARGPDIEAAGPELVSLPAPQERANVQPFRAGKPDGEPRTIDPAAAPDDLARPGLRVLGHRAGEIAAALGAGVGEPVPGGLAARLVRIAARRWPETGPRPAPFYVRPADAAPMREAAPVLLDDA